MIFALRFIKAVETIKEVDNKRPGPNPKAEKTLWTALIDHLKRNQLLPVVAFTFSRAKCDQNGYNLTSIDLTTEREKHRIYKFFDECIKTLKEPDRNIPQVINMKDILLRGIGIHHSGILPIMKEIVEMLFQNGLIKVRLKVFKNVSFRSYKQIKFIYLQLILTTKFTYK